MHRLASIVPHVVLLGGCNLYFSDPPQQPQVDAGGMSQLDQLARPCIRTVSGGDVLPDGRDELFVTYSCDGGPVIANVIYRDGLVELEPRADFQLRFARTVVADLDAIAPSDIIALDSYGGGWAFSRREFSGLSGHSFGFERAIEDIVVGDLDGDGTRDLIVAGDGAVRAVLGESGTQIDNPFARWPFVEEDLFAGSDFAMVALAELGGSGAPDLLAVARVATGFEVSTAIQTAATPLAFTVAKITIPEQGSLHPILTSDVDGDQLPDLIGVAGRVFVRGSKHGTIAVLGEDARSIAVGDIDGDGLEEVVFVNADGTQVRRVHIDATGSAPALTSSALLADGADAVILADLVDDSTGRDELFLIEDLDEPSSRIVRVPASTFLP